jgi:hypothetical protein
LSPKTKDNARYPYNEVWHTAKLIPAGPGGCIEDILISSILIARFHCITAINLTLWAFKKEPKITLIREDEEGWRFAKESIAKREGLTTDQMPIIVLEPLYEQRHIDKLVEEEGKEALEMPH